MAAPFYLMGGQMEEVEPLFLVACKDDVVFWKSLDASNKVKNAHTLALMLETVVMDVGVENVVQIITDNPAAYVAAGKFKFFMFNMNHECNAMVLFNLDLM